MFENYSLCSGMVYEMTEEKIKEEIERYEAGLEVVNKKLLPLRNQNILLHNNLNIFRKVLKEKEFEKIESNFKLNEKHLKLLSRLNININSDDYLPEIDQKRPLGSSDVQMDINEVLGFDRYAELEDSQLKEVKELKYALEYIINNFKIVNSEPI